MGSLSNTKVDLLTALFLKLKKKHGHPYWEGQLSCMM
jgi:hypothetical protein